jgi:general secretion pathway protein K
MRRKQSGAALLAVLWLTVILSFVGLALAGSVRTELEATRNLVDAERGYFLARGALEAAVLQLTSPPASAEQAEKRYGQRELSFEFETGTARVEILPEAARLNVNAAPPQVLRRLFQSLGLEDRQARDLAAAIDAARLELPFRNLEDLLMIPGMTQDLYYGSFLNGARRPALEDVLSARRSGITVDANFAHPVLLASLPGLDEQQAAAIETARKRQPFRNLDELVQAAPRARSEEALPYLSVSGGGGMVTLLAHGRGRGAELERTVHLTFEPSPNFPLKYRVLEWKE